MTFGNRRDFLTVRPSYLLRIPDSGAKHTAFAAFVSDLKQVHQIGQLT